MHKDIFGEEESDEEDEAAAGDDAAQEDERISRILATDTSSRRGAGGGGGGKRKKEAAAKVGAKPKKRLKKSGEKRGAASSSGNAEDGDGDGVRQDGDGEGEEEGEEEDSDTGMEAIEEGGKGDFDSIIGRMKGRRGSIVRTLEANVSEVSEIQEAMEQAVKDDDNATKADIPQPAIHKAAMLPQVFEFLQKRHLHETMMDRGMLSTLAAWLKPMPDGSLVNLQVRTKLLEALELFEVDETVLGSLRSSGLGKYIKLLSLHSKETMRNRRRAVSLMEKWKRPIFQSSTTYNASDVQVARPSRTAEELARELEDPQSFDEMQRRQAEAEEPGMARNTKGGARVPRPIGMDFQLQPESSVTPLPSNKYHKESTKGRLQEKMFGKSRGRSGTSQAVKLSVEGRTLDKF